MPSISISNKEEFVFDSVDGPILLVGITDRSQLEAVAITKSGQVVLYDIATGSLTEVGQLTFQAPQLNLQIHSLGDFVCITQKNGTYGTVLNLADQKFQKTLERGDYCASATQFPIALYYKDDLTFLIHGTDWNRLDITCLESDEILTKRIVDYDTDSNYFDYFHSSLSVSRDSMSFVSNGWHWHPYSQVTHYSIDGFLCSFELSHIDLELTDRDDPESTCYELEWDRPLCWIDDRTLGIGYNRGVGYHGEKSFPSEILIYDLGENRIVRRIQFDGFRLSGEGDVVGELYYNEKRQHFIGLNKKTGLHVTDLDGNVLLMSETLSGFGYNAQNGVFYRLDEPSRRIELIRFEY